MDSFNVEILNSFSGFLDGVDHNMIYILRTRKGRLSFMVNLQRYVLKRGDNFIIVDPQKISFGAQSDDLEFVVYSMTYSYFEELTVLFDDQFFKVLWGYTPDMLTDGMMSLSSSFLDQIYTIVSSSEYVYKKIIISNILQCYMLDLFEHTHAQIVDEFIGNTNHRKAVMRSFYNYIMRYKVRDVEFYAKKLNISTRNLYNITQASLRVAPKKVVDSTLLAVMKNLLLVSSFSNQQIAEKMNFSDQSAFGQYFKRCEGVSPSEYRRINRV